ncbi:MAG: non-canonical purine NTP pyrophosphatase, partial [Gammaproteobacteria bacterium]
ENVPFTAHITKLLAALENIPEAKRTARFYCVMVYLTHATDPAPVICQGMWEGRILPTPQGENGFGYDPIFYVPTHKCSAAELSLIEKNRISHRGQALKHLLNFLTARAT